MCLLLLYCKALTFALCALNMLPGVQVDTLNFEVVMSALEAVQISLTIMTSPNMAKQIYKEEVREVCPTV